MILGVLPPSGGSLTSLERTGQRTRFVNNYLAAYAKGFDKVYYFSYRDEDYELPDGCELVPNQSGSGKDYGLKMPFIHRRRFRECHVLRVMQAPGAHPAIVAKLVYGIPYVVTFGFDYAQFVRVDGGSDRAVKLMRKRERFACRHASAVIRPSHSVDERLLSIAPESRIVDIPNAVDCDLFAPSSSPPSETYPIFVGRLAPQKNLPLLIEALSGIPGVPLRIVGQGTLRSELVKLSLEQGVDLHMADAVPNEQLPGEFRKAGIFVLPSVIEGMPKVLLEAMACGCACLGSDSPGIRDLLTHNETGLLFDGSVEDCRGKLRLLLKDAELRSRLGKSAREFISSHYDLAPHLARELQLLRAVGEQGRRRWGVPKEAPFFE